MQFVKRNILKLIGLGITLFLIAFLAGLLVGVFFQAAQYVSEISYASGLRELSKSGENQTPDLAKASQKFARAANLNTYRDVYFLDYGQSLLFLASEEANQEKPDQNRINELLSDLIPAGQAAVDISPNKSSNWARLSQFYANIKPLAAGADAFIIRSLKAAIERDPKNPALHYQLSQAYLGASQVPDTSITQGADTDSDDLSDAVEAKLGSNPQNPDTDGNGVCFYRVAASNRLMRSADGPTTACGTTNPQALADNITSLGFSYWQSDGAVAAAVANVYYITMAITVVEGSYNSSFRTNVWPRNF